MSNVEQPRDRRDLKIQALLEKVSQLTTQYENQVADLRVDVTLLSERLGQYEDEEGNPRVQEISEPPSSE